MTKSEAEFLSTPSARRATLADLDAGIKELISIHALCEEGDADYVNHLNTKAMTELISIHALCEEGDERSNPMKKIALKFLSTPSARRATSRGVRPASKGSGRLERAARR